LLLPLTLTLLEKLFPVRSKKELKKFSKLDKIGYLGCSFLRSCLALNLAVHLVMIPVCLFCFGTFPLISCIYNLFIPPAVSLSMLLLILSPLSSFISSFNELFTLGVLKLIIESPKALNAQLSFPMTEWALFIILLTLFSLPLAIKPRESAC
jgi:hypothetical protein